MPTKNISAAPNRLARFLGATVKSVEKEFKYILGPRKKAPVQACPKARVAIPSPVVAPIPAPLAVPVATPVIRQPLPTVSAPVAVPIPMVKLPEPAQEIPAPEVVPFNAPSRTLSGLENIPFANKSEEVEAEIYFRDLQSSNRGTHLQALRKVKDLSCPTATAILRQQLSAEQDAQQILEILNALAGIVDPALTSKHVFSEYVHHQDAAVRLASLRAISKYHDEDSYNILTASIKDKDAEVRRQVLNCLCWTFAERSVPFAVNALHDADPGVRKAASQISGALKATHAISGLISLLSDPAQDVQAAAAAALKKVTGEDFGFKPAASKKVKDDAVESWRFWWRENQTRINRSKA